MYRKTVQLMIVKSWWVIAFLLLCLMLYEKGLQKREVLYRQLHEQLVHLQKEKEKALNQQNNLELQVNSQSDLNWIELTLMKGLGVVPEGYQKVYFEEESTHVRR